MPWDFNGRVALVTGASSGIGRATALAFAQNHARVIVSDVQEQGGQETVQLIRDKGGEAQFVQADVSSTQDVQNLIQQTVSIYQRLDFACNNAGIGGVTASTADYPEDAFRQVMDINLIGTWLCMKYEIPQMLNRGGGVIVNMASILGKVGFSGASAYVSAKHGMIGLTQTAALEYAALGLRVVAVCPGFIYTPMIVQAGMEENTSAYEAIRQLHPMKRLGSPQEIAETVVFLCSPGASFITGTAIYVDGGYTAQ
jgi:NAD(P)-dependent dehydrogenase (short-subunit alcohol dehydrogenase family)